MKFWRRKAIIRQSLQQLITRTTRGPENLFQLSGFRVTGVRVIHGCITVYFIMYKWKFERNL